MIFSVTGSDPANLLPEIREQPRTLGLDPTQALLNQLQGVSNPEPPKPSVSYKSVLITPSATWTTSEMTTSYVTTVTHTETSKVPILLRGQRVCKIFKQDLIYELLLPRQNTHSWAKSIFNILGKIGSWKKIIWLYDKRQSKMRGEIFEVYIVRWRAKLTYTIISSLMSR